MKKVAIITGATGGIGRKFVEAINAYEDIDEVWAVARNRCKLDLLHFEHAKVVAVDADLSNEGVKVIRNKLLLEKPYVRILVNNAGAAYMGLFEEMGTENIERLVRLNCSAPAALVSEVLPYMKPGARILNVSSASSFQPNPYLCMYSASKVFVKNFSRALSYELKPRKITVTAVCPGWVDTEMLQKEWDGKKVRYPGMISADLVVEKALADSSKGKDMSVPSFFAKYFRAYSKIMPSRIVMRQWVHSVKDYVQV